MKLIHAKLCTNVPQLINVIQQSSLFWHIPARRTERRQVAFESSPMFESRGASGRRSASYADFQEIMVGVQPWTPRIDRWQSCPNQ